jgi:hypothetical protein
MIVMSALLIGVFQAVDALAYDVYGSSAVIIDFANNRTRGYSRTQLDYDTAAYYTAYVCGELYKDGVYQVRACQSGFMTATIYTQYTGTSSTGSVVSDHYVDMQFFDEGQSSYVDYVGYHFLPGYTYPIDWLFLPPEIFGYYNPASIRLGSTTQARSIITIVNNQFDPTEVSINGVSISKGSAAISASNACESDNCLHNGDKVQVEIIQNTSGGVFTFAPSQVVVVDLNLGGTTPVNIHVRAMSSETTPKNYSFTIRVLDVLRPTPPPGSGFQSISSNVQFNPATGGEARNLLVKN